MKNRILRLLPCPPYDVEGTESWLHDMASQGWFLEKDGIFFGVASFQKGDPSPIRYRLEAALKQAGPWDDQNGMPDDEALEINANYGWDYVARRGQFYIYCNETPGARELNTDPAVQALAIKAVQKRQLSNFFVTIFWCILYPLFYFWRGFSLFLAIAEVGLPIVALSIMILLWIVLDDLIEIIHLQRLKAKLKANYPLNHNKKNHYAPYFIKKFIKFLFILLWVILALHLWSDDVMDANKQVRSDFHEPLPFATMTDFAEGTYEETWQDIRYDYVTEWSNAILSSGIIWSEHATIKREDGSALQGGLHVTYYEARSEWLAKVLATDYERFDRIKAKEDYEILDLPDLGVDSAIAYMNEVHFPYVILRQGNVMIRAYFYQTGPDEHIPLEEWVGILAESIK